MSPSFTGSSDWIWATASCQSTKNKNSPRSLLSISCSGRSLGSKPTSRITFKRILNKSLPSKSVRFQRTLAFRTRNFALSASTSSMETFYFFGLRWSVSMTSGPKPLSNCRFQCLIMLMRIVRRSTWEWIRAISSQPASWGVSNLESQSLRLCPRVVGHHRPSQCWKANV